MATKEQQPAEKPVEKPAEAKVETKAETREKPVDTRDPLDLLESEAKEWEKVSVLPIRKLDCTM